MYVTAFFMYSPTLRLNALGLARVVAFPSAKMMKFGHISSRPRHSPFRTTVQEKIKNTSNSKDIEDNHDANDRSEVQHQIDLIILIYCVYNIYIYYIYMIIYIYTHLNQFFSKQRHSPHGGIFGEWKSTGWLGSWPGAGPTLCKVPFWLALAAWWNLPVSLHTEGNHKEMIDDISESCPHLSCYFEIVLYCCFLKPCCDLTFHSTYFDKQNNAPQRDF